MLLSKVDQCCIFFFSQVHRDSCRLCRFQDNPPGQYLQHLASNCSTFQIHSPGRHAGSKGLCTSDIPPESTLPELHGEHVCTLPAGSGGACHPRPRQKHRARNGESRDSVDIAPSDAWPRHEPWPMGLSRPCGQQIARTDGKNLPTIPGWRYHGPCFTLDRGLFPFPRAENL